MTKKHVLILFIMTLSLLVFYSSPFPSGSVSESTFDLKQVTDFQNTTILNHGIPQTRIFTNKSELHYWGVETVTLGQVVYFSIDPNAPFLKDDFEVTIYDPSGIQTSLDPFYEILGITPPTSTKYLGLWIASRTGNWTLQVNDTRTVRVDDVSYEILASIPNTGYSDDSALSIGESIVQGNFTIDHEVQYWKVALEENQNCTVFVKETTPNVLNEAEVTVYSRGRRENPPPLEVKASEPLGSYNYSWNAVEEDEYFIEIAHKSPYTGMYNISFSAEQELYNFLTAKRLPHNQTITIRETHRFINKEYYFKFQVNSSRSRVNIRIYEKNLELDDILDFATVKVYDSGHQSPIHEAHEYTSTQDGEINITISLDEGKYYLILLPKSETKGTFAIHFEYSLPQPFVWSLPAILLSAILLVVFPTYLIYLDSKGKWYRISQWTVPASLKESYKFLKYSFQGIFNIKEVPNESILIRITSIPFKTFGLLNFVESSKKETLVILKRIHRTIELIIFFFAGIIVFDILNLLGFFFFSTHILPFYISNPAILFIVLGIPTISLGIIVFFVNIFVYTSYNQIIDRTTYIIQNYEEFSEDELTSLSLDVDQAWKNINYVRVLWNQAKHAFKDNNYELFVIKADASVKNLISTRYQQLVSPSLNPKPDFQFKVDNLRKRGFDLPSEKKIAHFRNLRNRIVHSSVTLNEKESVDCFAYYSTFISRLGLRSN